jgi:ParB-like chromosome segregation protein Spo0J
MAAKRLGMASVPAIRLAHLSEPQARALRLADNQIALNSGWDEALLAAEIARIRDDASVDLDVLGFSGMELDRLLAGVAEERESADRLERSYEQALSTAQSRVRSVSDYIDTRRGSVGSEARTRLNEAVRQLEAAESKKKSDIDEAIKHANGASMLAAQAQQLANNDVQAGQLQYQAGNRGRQSDMGAMVGGIILGNILTGGFGGGGGYSSGGGGGWTTNSYGGSSGGDWMGGGGRF